MDISKTADTQETGNARTGSRIRRKDQGRITMHQNTTGNILLKLRMHEPEGFAVLFSNHRRIGIVLLPSPGSMCILTSFLFKI